VIALSSAVVAVLVYADVHTALRPLLVAWFLLVCPGMAMLHLLRLDNGAMKLAIAVALSVAFDTLVAIGFLYGGWPNFDAMFTVVLVVTMVAVAVDLTVELGAGGARHR